MATVGLMCQTKCPRDTPVFNLAKGASPIRMPTGEADTQSQIIMSVDVITRLALEMRSATDEQMQEL